MTYLSTAELAQALGKSARYILNMRHRYDDFPKASIQQPKSLMWSASDQRKIEKWIAKHEHSEG